MEKLSIKVHHPAYVMMSSDYSQQEPKLTAFVAEEPKMINTFKEGRDIYATIASIAFDKPYEECLEFHPETHAYQPEGKERRSVAKVLVLGLNYGMSTQSIGQDLYGGDDSIPEKEKTEKAQKIFDAVMTGFPQLRDAILSAQIRASHIGYTETILGRRRHQPDMQLPEFQFVPLPGYINPDVDPLDPSTLKDTSKIPQRIVDQLTKEFSEYKYYGKIVKRTKELYEEHIKVINNRSRIAEASRKVWNCVSKDTEILTTSGWKTYDQVKVGDEILSYSLERDKIELDNVTAVHIYDEPTEVVNFNSPTFSASSTLNHRWVVSRSKGDYAFKTTENIEKNKWPDYPILRCSNNEFSESNISDEVLKLIGWTVTDGSLADHGINLYQSTTRPKNIEVYEDMIQTLDSLQLKYSDNVYNKHEHQIYVSRCDIVEYIINLVPNKLLPFSFISTLSQCQSQLLLSSMLQGDGSGANGQGKFKDHQTLSIICTNQDKVDAVQYLAFRAGYASNCRKVTAESVQSHPSSHKVYSSVGNSSPIQTLHDYYEVSILRIKHAQIYPHHKSRSVKQQGVWCVSTNNQTWVARKDGKVYITGNSIIQGSAAELTKLAILKLCKNERWNEIGGRLLVPVHDELIVEVPEEFREEGAQLLKESMEQAGEFLPFPIYCDIEETYRWYGISYESLHKYDRPTSLRQEDLSESNIFWLQCMLAECEYQLPVIGEKPKGDEAFGINGIFTPELAEFIEQYKKTYGLMQSDDQTVIDHMWNKVTKGVIHFESL